jgi:hypothetical protein
MHHCTVTGLLTKIAFQLLGACMRNSYEPGARLLGITNEQLPLARAVAALLEQLT